MGVQTFSHVGICVTDLEKSLRFYRDCLGFTEQYRYRIGPQFGGLMELEGVHGHSVFLERDGVRIELLAYDSPATTGTGRHRAMNELGLTHLGLRVNDLEATADALRKAGVTVLEATRLTLGNGSGGDWVFITDPDGVRIELIELPEGFAPGSDESSA